MGGATLALCSAQRLEGESPQDGWCWNVVVLLVVIPFQNIPPEKHICTKPGSRFCPLIYPRGGG